MRKNLALVLTLMLLVAGCTPGVPATPQAVAPTPAPSVNAPPVTPVPATRPPATLAPTEQPTTAPAPSERPANTPAALQPRYRGGLDLVPAELVAGECDQPSPLELPAQGLLQLAFVPTGICSNGEIGLVETGGRLYAILAGLGSAAFTIVNVTDPASPAITGAWQWRPRAITYDLKPFRQGERWYLALGMENQGNRDSSPCGIAIVDITDPGAPAMLGRHDGTTVGADVAWCNVHTTQIDLDERGDGAYILVSSRDTFDLRVLDIRDLERPREINVYHLHVHPHGMYPNFAGSYVHDTTIAGDRVYVAYWTAGVMVLDRRQLISGAEVTALNPPGSIHPPDFNAHHSYPTEDGAFLFVEAEDRPDGLRLYDIRDLAQPREVLSIELDRPLGTPHNLLVMGDLLFAGWYLDGVRVFRYDVRNPEQPTVVPVAFQAVRGQGDSPYGGVWGVRIHPCEAGGRTTTCIYASDILLGLVILALT